jgi:hypothetical protein
MDALTAFTSAEALCAKAFWKPACRIQIKIVSIGLTQPQEQLVGSDRIRS